MAGIRVPARRVGGIILAFSVSKNGSVKHDTLYPPAGVASGYCRFLSPAQCPRTMTVFKAMLRSEARGSEKGNLSILGFCFSNIYVPSHRRGS